MAPNALASCRGCLYMPKRWDAKNANGLSIEAASNWSLGRILRQKLWLPRWWDSRPPRRRSKGSVMRCTNKRGYQAPHCMGQSRWGPLIGKSVLPWMSGCGRDGGTARPEEDQGELLQVFCGPAARLNPITGPG